MTGRELAYVKDTIEQEGFDYAFINYSDFKDKVIDTEFHKLREAYVKAHANLAEYVGLA